MKYLRRFSSKEAYKNEVMPQVSILLNEDGVLFDSAKQVVNLSNINTELKNTSKDYTLNGTIDSTVLNVTGNTVNMTNSTVSGTIDKSISNAAISFNEMQTVDITNVNFDASTYNMVEIGLSSERLPSLVNISDCNFETMSNNAITIFGFTDNAVINIKNCHFVDVSNALRLSNKNGAKNVTVNIENCSCDKWDSGEYAGFLLLQEYPEGATEFSGITVNITNLIGPNGKVEGSIESICGTKDVNQVIYVYSDDAVQSYNSNIYPKININ